MAKQKNIWKFNDDEWKVHINDNDTLKKLYDTFGLDSYTMKAVDYLKKQLGMS